MAICDNSDIESSQRSGTDGFGERLREVIGSEPVSSFAKSCDISNAMIDKYLKGATPGIDKVERIARYSGFRMLFILADYR